MGAVKTFLDRFIWVQLAKAEAGRPDGKPFADALALARYASSRDLASFPICLATYIEQNKVDSARRRHDVGRVMLEVSRGRTMAAPGADLVNHEVDWALRRRFGRPLEPRAFVPFGEGASHALGVDVRREFPALNLLPSSSLQADVIAALREQMILGYEIFALCGPGPGEPADDRRQTYLQMAEDFVTTEEDQAARFRDGQADADLQRRTLLARENIRLMPYVEEACNRAGLEPSQLLVGGAESLTGFFLDLPVVSSQMEMIRLQHRNPQRRWTVNDYYDICAFSVAVVYCDVMVIEKHWAALMRRAKLDEKYGTTILDDLSELPAVLLAAA